MISEQLKAKIVSALVDEAIDLSETDYWKDVKFRLDGNGYCWTGHHKNPSWQHIFPMRTQHEVAFFKKLAGAKRNFIRRLER